MSDAPFFSNATFEFLEDLKANNDREWFGENKHRYERDLKDPALRFIEAFAPELKELSPHFMATPRSLFRIHRDTRFSKDKTPYKTTAGLHFRHDRAKDAHAPGFYLHVATDGCFIGVGIWHPHSDALRQIRDRIVEAPDEWTAASTGEGFSGHFTFEGDSLKRAPKGFDPEHPLVEDLRRKDFIGIKRVPQDFLTDAKLPERLARSYGPGLPLMSFLCAALDVPF